MNILIFILIWALCFGATILEFKYLELGPLDYTQTWVLFTIVLAPLVMLIIGAFCLYKRLGGDL